MKLRVAVYCHQCQQTDKINIWRSSKQSSTVTACQCKPHAVKTISFFDADWNLIPANYTLSNNQIDFDLEVVVV